MVDTRELQVRGLTLARSAGGGLPGWVRSGIYGLFLLGPAFFLFRGLVGFEVPDGQGLTGADSVFFSPTGGEPRLVLAVAFGLVVTRLSRLRSAAGDEPPVGAVGALLGAGLLLGLWSYYVGAPDLLVPSLALTLLGASALLAGRRGLTAMRLPAAFVLLALPLPSVMVNALVYPLQLLTARAAGWILAQIGVEVVLSGDALFADGNLFLVIESCSGLRGMHSLLMVALLLIDVTPLRGWRALLLVVLAPGVGFVINSFRVVAIVLSPSPETAPLHTLQGVVTIVVGVIVLNALGVALKRFSPPGGARYREDSSPLGSTPASFPARRATGLGALLMLTALASSASSPWVPPEDRQGALFRIPTFLDGWRSGGAKLDKVFLGSVAFPEFVRRSYQRGDEKVDLLIAADRRLDRRKSLISEKARVPGPGFVPVGEPKWITVDGLGTPVRAQRYRRPGQERLVYSVYWGVESAVEEWLRQLLALDRSPLRRPTRATLVAVSTSIVLGDSESAAERLSEFLGVLAGPLRRAEEERQVGA